MRAALQGFERDEPKPRALFLIPVLTWLVLCVMWGTILLRLEIEKAAVLRDTRLAARTLADSLRTHTLKTIHDVDEIALLVKYGYEKAHDASRTFDLHSYETHGLISSDTALQVTLVGPNGHVTMSTSRVTGDVDLSDREHFRVHRFNPDVGLFISRPVIGRISKHWSVQATRRLNHPDGSFDGVVVVSEDPAYLTDGFYNRTALGEHGMIAVLSRHGFMLSRRAADAHSTAGQSLPAGYDALLHERDATLADPLDHVERIVAGSAIDRYGLLAVAGLSVDDALDDYYRMRRVYVTMAIVISVMLVGFAAWIMSLIRKLLAGREALQRLSRVDRLTGLLNRGRISDLLEQAVAAPDAAGHVAVIFVDLDNLKQLNDTHGHQAGDAVLAALAECLRFAAGECGRIGRVGGDEFLVLVQTTEPNAGDAAALIVRQLDSALGEPVLLHEEPYRMTASCGVAVLEPNETADDLVRKADAAMYEAKECGRIKASPVWRARARAGNGQASDRDAFDLRA
ncbi:sensor domain-containing diguanylate cyclase [Trinickia mobilis]|uniref:sensor domain-containing diguanylate cyclase n=1 Tax=Trinickia mobilis TaxID=2816356 RepID=UPI001A8C3DDD|nr:sensor domain-containing diguanylate cyclase [Trinickia mobilis]